MSARRALLFSTAATLVACGGFLGFGDDDDDVVPAPVVADAGASAPEGSIVDEGGASVDAIAIATEDAGIDVIDTTPLDAASGSGLLVVARFETGIQGGDGADTFSNMAQSKVARIAGDDSARTQAGRPAILAWTLPPQDHVFVSFSVRIVTMPGGAGAALTQMTGAGETVSLVVTSNGVLGVRSGSNVAAASLKMQTGLVYRIGLELEKSLAVVRMGVVDANAGTGAPNLTHEIAWTSGSVDTVQIRTNDAMFEYVVDDVIVSTKGVTSN